MAVATDWLVCVKSPASERRVWMPGECNACALGPASPDRPPRIDRGRRACQCTGVGYSAAACWPVGQQGRVAQRESTTLTSWGSLVQSQPRPPSAGRRLVVLAIRTPIDSIPRAALLFRRTASIFIFTNWFRWRPVFSGTNANFCVGAGRACSAEEAQ